jgi:alpha-tubulin suppressor-like RCC1 family protein
MQTFRRNLANSARTHLVYSNLKRDLSTKLYVRGVGLFGALGISDELHDEPNFKELGFSKEYGKLKSISAGWGHSGALFDSGDAFIWGRPFEFSTIMRLNRIYAISSSVGRMFSKSTNSMFGSDNGFFPLPVRITTTGKLESIACSAGLTVCLNDKGEIWAFGQNTWMQCGFDSKPNFHIYEPVKIAVPKAKKIAVGLQHCLSLTEDGKIFAWGKTDKGRLGVSYDLKKEEFAAPPKEVFLPHPRTGRSLRAKEISAGFAHSAALADDGAVYIWGKGLSLTETEKGKCNSCLRGAFSIAYFILFCSAGQAVRSPDSPSPHRSAEQPQSH